MRTSCDIDVFVHEADLDRAIEVLVSKLEYRNDGRWYHDVSLYSPSNVHLELHFSLIEDDRFPKANRVLDAVWETARAKDGCRYHMLMSEEMYYFYHILHMAKHFVDGGCGVRPVLDTWVLCHRTAPDAEGRARLLREGGLDRFAACVQTLAAVWIDGATPTDESDSLGAFVLRGGVYGSDDGRSGVHAGREGRVRYALSRLFLPLSVMRRYSPVLQRHPYLLPVLWLWRPLTLVFGRGGKERRRALRQAQSVDTAAWGL